MTTPAIDPQVEVEKERAAREKEYGQYIAASTIYINGARAFNEGDAVPASHVSRNVVSAEQVRRVKPAAEKKV